MIKKTTIKLSQQRFTVSNGKCKVYVVNEEDKWSIETREQDDDFCFNNYTTKGSLEIAKTVIKLLEKAVGFIEKEIKEKK